MPPEETLGDVMRQLGIYDASAQTRSPLQTALQQPRRRPAPRQMRAPELRATDPSPGVRRQAEGELMRREAALADPRTAPRAPVNNQFAEAGAMALEGTGLPSIRRGTADVTRGAMNQDPMQGLQQVGSGALELGLGGLGVAGMGVAPRMTPRLPARAPALPEPMPRMTPPPREIAPNGMTIRPPEPFRNSLRGGSGDLADAASMRAPEPMAGGTPAALERAREAGFDEPFFHGTGRDIEGGFRRSGSGALGPGVYVARNPRTTEVFAGTPRGGVDADGRLNVEFGSGSNIMPLMVRGKKWATENQLDAAISRIMEQRGRYASRSDAAADAVEELRRQGYTGVADPERDFYNVFEPSNIRSRFAAFDPARAGENDLLASQAPTLPPQGFTRPQAPTTSPASAPPPRRGMFGPQQRPGVRDMQPEGIYGRAPAQDIPRRTFVGGLLGLQLGTREARAQTSLLAQVRSEFPALGRVLDDTNMRVSPETDGRLLEFYPTGERDSFDPTRNALEIFGDRATPLDVAGDIVSHQMAQGGDARITAYYRQFESSMTPQQQSMLREQYDWARRNAGETRSFEEWREVSGQPAFFRGYAFRQWENPEQIYTPQQMRMFDEMMGYLRRPTPNAPARGPNGKPPLGKFFGSRK